MPNSHCIDKRKLSPDYSMLFLRHSMIRRAQIQHVQSVKTSPCRHQHLLDKNPTTCLMASVSAVWISPKTKQKCSTCMLCTFFSAFVHLVTVPHSCEGCILAEAILGKSHTYFPWFRYAAKSVPLLWSCYLWLWLHWSARWHLCESAPHSIPVSFYKECTTFGQFWSKISIP